MDNTTERFAGQSYGLMLDPHGNNPQDEDMYVSVYYEVGTASQGKTIEEAAANLREATPSYLVKSMIKFPSIPCH